MTAILTVLKPTTITTTMRKSTTAVETVAPYAAGTTYAVGDRCRSDVTHRVYESVKASNTGHDPTLEASQTGSTPWWQDIGPTNDWAMFDTDVSTQTVAPSPMTVVVAPGFFTSAQFFGLDADFITITVKDQAGGNIIKHVEHELEGSSPGDYDEYFWDPFEPETGFALGDIDQYSKAEIAVTLRKTAGGTVACGAMVVGDEIQLGRTLSQPKIKPRSYSIITTDKFGKTSITRRKAVSDMEVTALLDLSEANKVLAAIQSLLDVPCAWKASNSTYYSGLRCFGLGGGDLTYDVALGKCQLNLTVQGIIQWQQ